jgi:hypothetical protein
MKRPRKWTSRRRHRRGASSRNSLLLGTALKDWHDFYVLLGTAAATLVGLTFVAASIGAGVLTRDHEQGLKTFITPTVVHFGAILGAALVILAPFPSGMGVGVAILAEAVIGIAYSLFIVFEIRRSEFAASLVLVDRVWYALAPVVAYCVVAGAAASLLASSAAHPAVLACGLGLLLLAGIRNAWDMMVWIMLRPRDKG